MLCRFGGLVNLVPDASADLGGLLVVEGADLSKAALEQHERIAFLPGPDFFRRAIGAVVVIRGVRLETIDLGLDQGRAVPAPGAIGGFPDHIVDGEKIGAIDDDPGKSITGGAIGDVVDRHLALNRDRDRIAVVLAEEDDREFVDTGEIAGLVEIALR